MKKTLLLGLASLAMVAGVGAGAKLASSFNPIEAAAEKTQTSTLYLTGSINSWTKDRIWVDSETTDLGYITSVELDHGDIFRFCSESGWETDCGWTQLQSSSEAYVCFKAHAADNNIYVNTPGTYNFYINKSKQIFVTFGTEATYSYVLCLDSGLGYNYMFGVEYSLTSWGSSPSVSGQAYDVLFDYNEYNYYGLYRIDDRLLKNYTGLIIKDSEESGGAQTGDITRTAGNTQEAYIIHWVDDPESEDPKDGEWNVVTKTKTSDEYKALDFLYDLVTHRGGATYDGFDFAYSICATDPDTADRLAKAYDAFSGTIKTLLSKAQLRTYNLEGAHAEDNKDYASVADMVEAMKIIVAKNKGLGGANQVLGGLQENNNAATLITVALVSLASIALGGFFVFHKKRAK